MTAVLYAVLAAGILVFVTASVARARWYARHPLHLRWELYPVPHEAPDRAGRGGSCFETSEWWCAPRTYNLRGELAAIAREILFLHALREFNRPMWYRSFPFHLGLYLLSGASVLVVLAALVAVTTGGAPAGVLGSCLRGAYAGLGLMGLFLATVGAATLLWHRLADRALRAITTAGDIFNLVFFLTALGLLGTAYVLQGPDSPGVLRLVVGLLTWDMSLRVPRLLASGLIVSAALLAYIPLTHMSHFMGKYFTYHAVRWDDRPRVGDKAVSAALAEYLTYRPTWAASHIAASDRATWADVVSTNPAREPRP